ncbi:glycoside hydrolase family 89 protein [Coniophora puteana RWD-64-598 SS2]|uniref:Glycoside hydrolase family 89 protein n=1 Tax=Coniophora puteana (strain RWD-64-598) TaxID=741705 RepID=A0A5M3ME37_CONPW|nr:glycoside hydrolase family 89 protein [Coniophora puteana RWD-64-598 SS2]EIW77482.1 glycoside hydrolase family 89 protein [Coniophora puteana RWD-64-598 SS2]
MRLLGFVSLVGSIVGATSTALSANSSESDPLQGLYALVQRRIPSHAHSFTFSFTNSSDSELDTFTLTDAVNKTRAIHVECNTVSACSRGLYTYLTEYGGVDIWWTGSRLDQLPAPLPAVKTAVTRSAIVPYRYMFNTVTFDYTSAFWTFDDWELMLDWLSLRGVNLPLAWVGFEHTLVEVFREYNITDADISGFLSGPAFQAWNRFGNIQGSWGGDLPTQWIDDQFVLGKQIVQRMVDLGMTPVLPAFTGFVPPAMHNLYPNASIVNGSAWNDFAPQFTNDSFLEPFDPLFAQVQQSFISKQQAAFGNVSHIYTLDQYNENDPYSGDPSYLTNISAATFSSLRAADPDATWLMQGWLFFSSADFWTPERVEAYLAGVPGDDDGSGMLILDLYSEAQPQWQRLSSYFGKRWIWCELHDYGGNMGFEGNFANVTEAPLAALASPNVSMVGVGLTPEGMEGNEIIYDVLLDQAWSSSPINKTEYAQAWATRRYPADELPECAIEAWQTLAATVYSNTDPGSQATVKSILELEPALSGLVNVTGHHPTHVFYDTNTTIVPALQQLVQAGHSTPSLLAIPEYRYDLVDLTRQLLVNRFIDLYADLLAVYNTTSASSASVSAAGQPMLELVADLDKVLMTNENFQLSRWTDAARSWANGNASYAAYLEYNARNQITLWGPKGEINDYASKQWGGLVGDYYGKRWAMFIQYLEGSKSNGTVYNATAIAGALLDIGEQWSQSTSAVGARDTMVVGDTWLVVQEMAGKWA